MGGRTGLVNDNITKRRPWIERAMIKDEGELCHYISAGVFVASWNGLLVIYWRQR